MGDVIDFPGPEVRKVLTTNPSLKRRLEELAAIEGMSLEEAVEEAMDLWAYYKERTNFINPNTGKPNVLIIMDNANKKPQYITVELK